MLDLLLGSALWLGPVLAPLVALLLLLVGSRLRAAVAFAALPALLVALIAPTGTVDLPWLLLSTRVGLDETGRIFLIFTASLWLAAGIHGWSYLHEDRRRATFFAFFNTAMAGNLGVILAQDAASFYVFFALMSFASYGLVVHTRSPDAFHAGRVYIVLVIAGELALFVAIVLWMNLSGSMYFSDFIAASAAAPTRDWAIAATLIALGIKVGAVPLHVWLPLAHPAAPTPASAVLSGAMIKAGLLGWLRFLPLGTAAPGWGHTMIMLGLTAVFGGALIGALQREPKSALAYSSISQMGFITVLLGVALSAPEAAPAAGLAAALYAFHHAFAKALLFLGVSMLGVTSKTACVAVAAGMMLPALALAGAPLTSGAVAKAELKAAVIAAGWNSLTFPLSLAAVATTLVMLRTLYLARHASEAGAHAPNTGMWAGWWLLVIGCAAPIWFFPQARANFGISLAALANALWPILLGLGLAVAGWRARWSIDRISLPPGDLLVPLLRAWPRVPLASVAWQTKQKTRLASRLPVLALGTALSQAEVVLMRRAGLAIILLAAAILALAMS
ncbi:MAG: complex I subunit 5 family protein [Hyphomicrobiaceae bacterium]